MEKPQDIPEISGNCGCWFAKSAIWFFYELFGTFFLLLTINATQGNAAAIGLVLFLLLKIGAPLTGAHYNPAVTIGVFINKEFNWKSTIQAVNYMCAQFIGGLLGAEWIYAITENARATPAQRAAQFPHLLPRTEYWGQALLIETACTFIFVMANILVKDSNSIFNARGSLFGANILPQWGWFGCATIAMTLAGMIFVAGPHTGGGINPAVGVANHMLSEKLFKNGTVHDSVARVYILGDFLGGIIAGCFSRAHGWFLDMEAFNPKAEPAAAAPADLGQDKGTNANADQENQNRGEGDQA